MYKNTWNKHRTPQWEQQSTTNKQQLNRRIGRPIPSLLFVGKINIVRTSVWMHLTTIQG